MMYSFSSAENVTSSCSHSMYPPLQRSIDLRYDLSSFLWMAVPTCFNVAVDSRLGEVLDWVKWKSAMKCFRHCSSAVVLYDVGKTECQWFNPAINLSSPWQMIIRGQEENLLENVIEYYLYFKVFHTIKQHISDTHSTEVQCQCPLSSPLPRCNTHSKVILKSCNTKLVLQE